MTERDKKRLWAKSGNKCAICSHDLIIGVGKDDTVIGDECHIISKKKSGPRYAKKNDNYYDSYDNMILLCKTHHKMIDDNEENFTEEILHQIKKNHEEKIRKLMEPQSSDSTCNSIRLSKLNHTRDLVRCLTGALQYATDYPVEKEEDYDLFETFADMIQNMDVIEDMSEFYKISIYKEIVDEIHKRNYVILIGFVENYGKYLLDTAFVFIRTKEDYEKNTVTL